MEKGVKLKADIGKGTDKGQGETRGGGRLTKCGCPFLMTNNTENDIVA